MPNARGQVDRPTASHHPFCILLGIFSLCCPCPADEELSELWWKPPRIQREGAEQEEVGLAMRNGLGMDFVFVPKGEFELGDKSSRRDVTLSLPIWVKATEVTRSEWFTVVGSRPWQLDEDLEKAPADGISWFQAVDFCQRLSLREGLVPAYQLAEEERDAAGGLLRAEVVLRGLHARGYRLPTEAEWEICCRAGTRGDFWSGRKLSDRRHARFDAENPVPVGSFQPNDWGLYDVAGNLAEWCWDAFGELSQTDAQDPLGPETGTRRVVRGGSFADGAEACRSHARTSEEPDGRDPRLGFRPVRTVSRTWWIPTREQLAAAEELGVPVAYRNRTSMRFALIPAGSFSMGCPPEKRRYALDERAPLHEVTLTRSFYMQSTETTRWQYHELTRLNTSNFESGGADIPVDSLTWIEMVWFCNRLSEEEGLETAYEYGDVVFHVERLITADWSFKGLDSPGYRLPTEAEWEYACRAGTTGETYAGELEFEGANDVPVLGRIAWYRGNAAFEGPEGMRVAWPETELPLERVGPQPVARREANAFGLFDMLGNVGEYCHDHYGELSSERTVDPLGPAMDAAKRHVFRGGSWAAEPLCCRASIRLHVREGQVSTDGGFRPVRSVVP